MARTITGIVTWLKNWFYDIGQINTFLDAKANKNQSTANYNVVTDGSGDISVEPKINVATGSGLSLNASTKALSHSNSVQAQSSAVFKKFTYDAQGHITGNAPVYDNDLPSHSHDAYEIIDALSNTYNLDLQARAQQSEINSAIASKLATLSGFSFIEIRDTKPTASADTMGKLYIISENSKVNVYYTKRSGTSPNYTYELVKMDTDILDEYSVAWSDITSNPFANYTPSNFSATGHSHGLLDKDGKVVAGVAGAQADKLLITDGQGYLTVMGKDHSSTATTFGVATSTKYGHVQLEDAITDGSQKAVTSNAVHDALSGYVTSIEKVPYADDNTGALILYYGDEPSS